MRGSIPFDELKLEYKTRQRYQTYRIFVPPAARPRLPLPGGYDRTGSVYAFVPKPGLEKCLFVMDRVEGHRRTCFFQRVALRLNWRYRMVSRVYIYWLVGAASTGVNS